MIEEAQQIFDYLPISRNNIENDYIQHLWGALQALDKEEEYIRGFAILPLHLLFLLALQCRILRIAQEQKDKYKLSISLKVPKNGQEEILEPTSPFVLAYFNESELPDLCKSIGLERAGISKIKKLIKYRNKNLAHARGSIEMDPDGRVIEYLDALNSLQEKMLPLNEEIAKMWIEKLTAEDDLKEFTEINLSGSYLCPIDFNKGLLQAHFSSL